MIRDSYIVSNIRENILKVKLSSNLYFISKGKEKILIDAGHRMDRKTISFFFSNFIDFNSITKVIFTHLHHDHCGNFDLFLRAQFYASKDEIESFKQDPVNTVMDKAIAEMLKIIKINPAEELNLDWLKIIPTPGHTKGSICVFLPEEKIIFSGDTLFKKGIGVCNAPTSLPDKMQESLNKLVNYNFRTICAGHEEVGM